MTIRDFIDLVEAAHKLEEAPLTPPDTNPSNDVTGRIDSSFLLQRFKEVNDPDAFKRAMDKIMQNRIQGLSRVELIQLAYAYISLVRLDPTDSSQVLRKLSLVRPKH
jgi:hypothetical protein